MKSPQPDKPCVGYPLFAPAAGVWAKKINGRFYYFGPWDDPQDALDRYIVERDFLYAGRTPPSKQHAVSALLTAFLADKQNHLEPHLESSEVTESTFSEYQTRCEAIG